MLHPPGRAERPGQEPTVPWKCGLVACLLCCWRQRRGKEERKPQKRERERREDEVEEEEEIQRADVAAMVTSVTHGGANATVTNSFMLHRLFSCVSAPKSCSDGGDIFVFGGSLSAAPPAAIYF